jgi:quercetin dioxygenase-like cupin family protein
VSWSVRNLRDMQWWDEGPGGFFAELVEDDDRQVGVRVFVLGPGQPMSMYHLEADQEGFLVLSGEALLIVEDEEHPLRQWDYFHCPPNVPHTIVGAGSGPSAILALGARIDSVGEDWGAYPYSEVAMKHGASAPEDTTDSKVAYAHFPERQPGEFREAWLP